MGVADLHKLLRKHVPQIYEQIHISEYAFKKVAIDVSLYLCKYKAICGDRWITAFVNLVACLRKNEVHSVFIYDTGCVPDKQAEHDERKKQKEKLQKRVYNLEEAMEKYHMSGKIDEILIELYNKTITKEEKKGGSIVKRLMPTSKKSGIDMKIVEDAVKKMRSHLLDIKPEDFALTKKLFDRLNVPYYDAPLEAETTCSDLCKRGLVDAVLSEDTDVLAYGATVFLHDIDTGSGTCMRIKHSELLEELSLDYTEFLDLCIMMGTDYGKRVFKFGPESIYKAIRDYSTIEAIADAYNLDINCLNHLRCREIFTNYAHINIPKVPYCGPPDFVELEKFITKNNIKVNVEGLKRALTKSTAIVFEVDSDDEANIEEEIEKITKSVKNVKITRSPSKNDDSSEEIIVEFD
jgi:5'-3' exonuclease